MRNLRKQRVTIAEGGRETFVFLMLNELAQSGQVNAHNFQYETVALARECDSFIEGSDWSRSTFSTLYRRVKEHMAGLPDAIHNRTAPAPASPLCQCR